MIKIMNLASNCCFSQDQ